MSFIPRVGVFPGPGTPRAEQAANPFEVPHETSLPKVMLASRKTVFEGNPEPQRSERKTKGAKFYSELVSCMEGAIFVKLDAYSTAFM